jgi:hypothetical protein
MAHEHQVSSVSGSRSIEEMAAFWDTHDAADYDDQTHEALLCTHLRLNGSTVHGMAGDLYLTRQAST